MQNQKEMINFNLEGDKLQLKKKLTLIQSNIETDESPLFSISIDGSTHADLAFDVVTQDFALTSCRMLAIYIYNSQLNDQFNHANKKENVMEKYNDKISRSRKNISFLFEDRDLQCSHALQQVNKLAETAKSNYLIAGYYGIKGPKSENTELTKGINYLLSSSIIPTIIIKNTISRKDKPEKGHNWLFVFDRQYINSIRCLRAFLPLIDKENDCVYGLSLSEEHTTHNYDDTKSEFIKEMEYNKIVNFQYESSTYQRYVSTFLAEKINFGSVLFDFLVFYNNSLKHKVDGNNSESAKIVKNCNCSICFYSI